MPKRNPVKSPDTKKESPDIDIEAIEKEAVDVPEAGTEVQTKDGADKKPEKVQTQKKKPPATRRPPIVVLLDKMKLLKQVQDIAQAKSLDEYETVKRLLETALEIDKLRTTSRSPDIEKEAEKVQTQKSPDIEKEVLPEIADSPDTKPVVPGLDHGDDCDDIEHVFDPDFESAYAHYIGAQP
jgi:hypothetical protein